MWKIFFVAFVIFAITGSRGAPTGAKMANVEQEIVQHSPMSMHDFQLVKQSLAQLQEIAEKQLLGRPVQGSIKSENDSPLSLPLLFNPGFDSTQTGFQHQHIISQFLFEGDIVLTAPQAQLLVHNARRRLATTRARSRKLRSRRRSDPRSGDVPFAFSPGDRHARVRRKMYSSPDGWWNPAFPIQYRFASTIAADEYPADIIHDAVQFWQNNTCLSFRYSDSPQPPDDDHLLFFKGMGCYSMIGRVGGSQGISIGRGCTKLGVVAHEIAHALGLWHEQSRPQCMDHIRLVPENIIPIFISNFLHRDLSEVIDLGVPYDLGSVMHYGPQAFTNDFTKNAIETLRSGYQRTIGQREIPAFYDVKMINTAYCSATCAGKGIRCEHGGYPHPRHCSECICPDGLGGPTCEKAASPVGKADCGGVLDARSAWSEISSPGYPDLPYVTGQSCSWLIKVYDQDRAPEGSKVQLEFIGRFQFFCTATCLDYVEVKNGTDLGLTGMRFCCFEAPAYRIESETNLMIVIMRITASTDIGFSARFRHNGLSEASTDGEIRRELPLLITGVPPEGGKQAEQLQVSLITGSPDPKKNETEEDSGESVSDSRWSEWSSWSECSKSCGACGVKSRTRFCHRPPCLGDKNQFRRCGFEVCKLKTPNCRQIEFRDFPCVSNDRLVCSEAHEVGVQFGTRCEQHHCCSPYTEKGGLCQLSEDAGGVWGQWGAWGHCNQSRFKTRLRVCDDFMCSGSDFETKDCR